MSKPANYLFQSYNLRAGSTFRNTRFLFNSARHLRLQSEKNWRLYELREEGKPRVIVRVAFHIENELAASPLRAPFGFAEFYKQISTEALANFLLRIEADLKSRGVQKINLKSYPEMYDPHAGKMEAVLQRLQYAITSEVSSIIEVDSKLYEKKVKISERQKLIKANKLFSFERVRGSYAKEIYSFIAECRKEKGQTLSMSLPELIKTVSVFPKNFFFYRVYDTNGTAAAAIVIKVNSKILYTFYYAHGNKFDKVSPVVLLISGIYELARQQGIELIDLGTSMLNGKINRSLLHFKRSIGGQSNRKLIFEKTL